MNAPDFQYPPYVYRCTVSKVVDGDTVDVDIDVGFGITVHKRLRFLGVDTYETRGKEKEKGLEAKFALEEMIYNAKAVYVQTKMDATGKYGRVLAWLWVADDEGIINVNQQLLIEGHGVPYEI